jgi:hypothetical protein
MLTLSQSAVASETQRRLPTALVVCACAVGAGAMLLCLTGSPAVAAIAAGSAALEGLMAAAILVSAGGWASPIVRRITRCNDGAVVALTSIALGLWVFSTAMLIVGSTLGALSAVVWWPVILAGVVLAAWQCRKRLASMKVPSRLGYGSALWLVIGAAVGAWIAGCMRPTGFIGMMWGDGYDVLTYHLQVPREFYEAGRIGPLWHNVYSFYPLNTEMLYLLAMCLRGGAYQGMYLATMMHGTMLAIAAAAAYCIAGPAQRRGMYAVAVMIGAPLAIQLSWLAMVELAMLAHLMLALLWLQVWLKNRDAASAATAGMMIGIACAAKYISLGMAAAPVIAVMLAMALRSRRLMGHVGLCIVMMLLMMSPWLVRNTLHTTNPLFPLATGAFGRGGHWSPEHQQRWRDGHGPAQRPPVPVPQGWRAKPAPGRPELFIRNFLFNKHIGYCTAVLAIAAAAMAAFKRDKFALVLSAVMAIQLCLWTFFSHGMPVRFVLPVLGPAALLIGGLLSGVTFGRGKAGPALCALVVVVNFWPLPEIFRLDTRLSTNTGRQSIPMPPVDGGVIADLTVQNLGPDARAMLIGEVPAFYHRPGTVYATPFDPHPLEMMIQQGLSPAQIRDGLARQGVTHLWVNWREIKRLANTYGYPTCFSEGVQDLAGDGPLIRMINEMGAKPVVDKPGLTIFEINPDKGRSHE